MARPRVGMKIYTPDWYVQFGLDYRESADLLSSQGVDLALVANGLLPLPEAASLVNLPPDQEARYRQYRDRTFRDALGHKDIDYYAACVLFFNPPALERWPDLRPVDQRGQPARPIDWYIGLCPTHEAYLADRIDKILDVIKVLEPDGLFLAFIRFPGFWEIWLPQVRREEWPEYCFCDRCLSRFQRETGISVPERKAAARAHWILNHHRQAWTGWKCGTIRDIVARIRQAAVAVKPDLKIMLNTLPFDRHDYDNAIEEVFGQRFEALAEVVEVFEVMTYHQILKRPVAWIPEIGEEVKARTHRTVLCTLQAQASYLTGMHRKAGRQPTITTEEFAEVVSLVKASSTDGIVVFLWQDFLHQALVERDLSRIQILQRLAGLG